MSNSSPTVPRERNSRLSEAIDADSLSDGVRILAAPLRVVAFWLAVALPFFYLPLLYGGLTGPQAQVFVSLLVLNVLALVAGHGYGR